MSPALLVECRLQSCLRFYGPLPTKQKHLELPQSLAASTRSTSSSKSVGVRHRKLLKGRWQEPPRQSPCCYRSTTRQISELLHTNMTGGSISHLVEQALTVEIGRERWSQLRGSLPCRSENKRSAERVNRSDKYRQVNTTKTG